MAVPDKREKRVVYPFYLKFCYTYWCSCFSQNQHGGSVAETCKCNRNFYFNSLDFFLALEYLHFSEVLLPMGMTAQGGTFQGPKWKQKPSWSFTQLC